MSWHDTALRKFSSNSLFIEQKHFISNPIQKIDDAETVLRAIRLAPEDQPIDIILHTRGGLVLAASQIVDALKT